MQDLIYEIAESSSSSLGAQDLWESLVVPLFPGLTIANVRAWFQTDISWLGAIRGDRFLAIFALCGIGFRVWNDQLLAVSLGGGLGSVLCQTQVKNGYCNNLAGDPDAGLLGKRYSTRSFIWSTSVGANTYGRTLVSQPVSQKKRRRRKCISSYSVNMRLTISSTVQ